MEPGNPKKEKNSSSSSNKGDTKIFPSDIEKKTLSNTLNFHLDYFLNNFNTHFCE